MARILLVDDHPLYHEGLASAFARLAPDLSIISAVSAEDGLEVLRCAPSAELALIDLVLPTSDGFAALLSYAAAFPHIPRVLISGKEEASVLFRARNAGASGFIRKSLSIDRLIGALRGILEGGAFFEGESAQEVHVPSAPSEELTLRQLEVLRLLGNGLSNKEISSTLAIAERTVRAHLTELFRVLGVDSRTQAILAGQRLGLLESGLLANGLLAKG